MAQLLDRVETSGEAKSTTHNPSRRLSRRGVCSCSWQALLEEQEDGAFYRRAADEAADQARIAAVTARYEGLAEYYARQGVLGRHLWAIGIDSDEYHSVLMPLMNSVRI